MLFGSMFFSGIGNVLVANAKGAQVTEGRVNSLGMAIEAHLQNFERDVEIFVLGVVVIAAIAYVLDHKFNNRYFVNLALNCFLRKSDMDDLSKLSSKELERRLSELSGRLSLPDIKEADEIDEMAEEDATDEKSTGDYLILSEQTDKPCANFNMNVYRKYQNIWHELRSRGKRIHGKSIKAENNAEQNNENSSEITAEEERENRDGKPFGWKGKKLKKQDDVRHRSIELCKRQRADKLRAKFTEYSE